MFTGSGTVPTAACPQITLTPGASITCTATYATTQADVDAGSIQNTAIASGTPPTGQDAVSPPSNAVVAAEIDPSLSVVKSATPSDAANYAVGEVITYSFVITNAGNVTLTDVQPIEGTFTGTGTMSAPACPAGSASLAPGDQVTCTATYTVTQADIDAGSITNNVTATGTPPIGPDPVSPPSTVTVPELPAAALTIVKTASLSAISTVGQTVTYSFLVTNTGNVTLTNVTPQEGAFSGSGTLSAPSCPAAAASMLPGARVTCTASYTVTPADLSSKSLVNTAVAIGDPPTGQPVTSSPSTVTIPDSAAVGSGLAGTGLVISGWVLFGAPVLLLLGLGAILFSRRRRRDS
jgi:hypothetical protein